jgi:hypothetical protein
MDDNLSPCAQHHDDELAEFTDQLLSGDEPETLTMAAHDRELLALQEIVVRLKRAFETDQPDEDMTRQAQSHLVAEWHKAGFDAQAESAWQRWQRNLTASRPAWQPSSKRRRIHVAILIAVIGIVLFALLLITTPISDSLPGAAGGGQVGLGPAILILGFVLGGVVWWFIRRQQR